MEIISKSEARANAAKLRVIPDKIVEEVNALIAKGYALTAPSVVFCKPDNMEGVTWRALGEAIASQGYTVKPESSQRDGMYMTIFLDT